MNKIKQKLDETARDILTSKQVEQIKNNKYISAGIEKLKLGAMHIENRTNENYLKVLLIKAINSSGNLMLDKRKFNIVYDYINSHNVYFNLIDENLEGNINSLEDLEYTKQTYEELKKLFNNEFLLDLDDETFENIIQNSLQNTNYYFVNKVLNSQLNKPKKLMAINYVCNLAFLHINESKKSELDKYAEKNMFKIAFSPKSVLLIDEDYQNTLDKVFTSVNPEACATILSDNLLTNSRKDEAIKLLSKQTSIAHAATSNVLKLSPKYTEILKLVSYYEKDEKYNSKLNTLLKLFSINNLISNQNRLIRIINMIIDYDDMSFINSLIDDFVVNNISLYYNDMEFNMACFYLEKAYKDKEKYNACIKLLTNEKIKSLDKMPIIKYLNNATAWINEYNDKLSKRETSILRNGYELLRKNVYEKIVTESIEEQIHEYKLKKD